MTPCPCPMDPREYVRQELADIQNQLAGQDPDTIGEPLTPELRKRLIAAAERQLRVRREILLLAGHATRHLPGKQRTCRTCHQHWPCPDVTRAASPALDAYTKSEP